MRKRASDAQKENQQFARVADTLKKIAKAKEAKNLSFKKVGVALNVFINEGESGVVLVCTPRAKKAEH